MDGGLTDQVLDWVRNRYFGKYRGVVTDNNDPTKRGRLKVRVPAVLGDEKVWAMPCVGYAGNGVGSYLLPESGDGVWVEFEGGDPSFPIWVGCFWADNQLPKNESGTEASPPLKVIRSKEGLMVTMDDGEQTISVSDKDGSNILTIEVQRGQITVKGATKAVVEAPSIELVENASHPVVFGDELMDYLREIWEAYTKHTHPSDLCLGFLPMVALPTDEFFKPPLPTLISQKVKSG